MDESSLYTSFLDAYQEVHEAQGGNAAGREERAKKATDNNYTYHRADGKPEHHRVGKKTDGGGVPARRAKDSSDAPYGGRPNKRKDRKAEIADFRFKKAQGKGHGGKAKGTYDQQKP